MRGGGLFCDFELPAAVCGESNCTIQYLYLYQLLRVAAVQHLTEERVPLHSNISINDVRGNRCL